MKKTIPFLAAGLSLLTLAACDFDDREIRFRLIRQVQSHQEVLLRHHQLLVLVHLHQPVSQKMIPKRQLLRVQVFQQTKLLLRRSNKTQKMAKQFTNLNLLKIQWNIVILLTVATLLFLKKNQKLLMTSPNMRKLRKKKS